MKVFGNFGKEKKVAVPNPKPLLHTETNALPAQEVKSVLTSVLRRTELLNVASFIGRDFTVLFPEQKLNTLDILPPKWKYVF